MPSKLKTFSSLSKGHYRSLVITATLANIIDHLETALYLFLAPVIIRDFLSQSVQEGLFTWSLGLPLGGTLRIVLALTWGYVHARLGSRKILYYSLFAVASSSLAIGMIGLWATTQPGSISYLLVAIFTLLRALQSLFSMAETHASKSLIMSCPDNLHTVASTLANASSICGTFFASALCLLVCYWDPELKQWPWIYLVAGAVTLLLATSRSRFHFEAVEEGSHQPLNLLRAALCSTGSTFGYATFHWISVITSPQLMQQPEKLAQQSSYLSSQTFLMGSDLLLLLAMGLVAKYLGALRLVVISPWICLFVALGYGLGVVDTSLARWMVLLPGVASAGCYGKWLVELTRPRYLFPYSCLAGAVGSMVGGILLSWSLFSHAKEAGIWMEILPFILIFFAQALVATLWMRGRLPRPSKDESLIA